MELKDFGELGKAIDTRLADLTKTYVAEAVAPVRILPEDLDDKTVFDLDDMVRILGKSADLIKAAYGRGEIPGRKFGRDLIFPRPLVVAYLTGEWIPETKQTVKKQTPKNNKLLEFVN